jgi:hypothetical protein
VHFLYLRIDIDKDIRENEVSERANLLIKGHRFSLNNVAKSVVRVMKQFDPHKLIVLIFKNGSFVTPSVDLFVSCQFA